MAKKVKKELADILARYDLKPDEALWDCHGTLVIYHKSCELIAAKAGITFDPPQIIEAKSGEKVVAICAIGRMGERCEWSIGEAAPGNNKNAYPYAMAEKRAKDRVILKLAGLSAYIHSEEEADDFTQKPRGAVEVEGETKTVADKRQAGNERGEFWQRQSYELPGDNLFKFGQLLASAIAKAPTGDDLLKLEEDNRDHIAALRNGSASEAQKINTALTEARKKFIGVAA